MSRLQDTLNLLPRHSIMGRIVHPLFEERRTLAGRMAWIGIVILLAFILLAIFAGMIAPFDPVNPPWDEKDTPPWVNAPIARNDSFQTWTGNWTFASLPAAQRADGVGAVSNRSGDTEEV